MRSARRARWAASPWVFCSLMSLTGPLAAQDDAELARARATFQQAVELEQAGNCPAALNLFRQVGQVRMTPQVRFHIGICEAQLGRLVAALGGFQLALADADSVGRAFREEVEENVRKLQSRIPKLTLKRGAGADTAMIELDGTSLGNNSIGVEVPLDPGPHAITARAVGYKRYETTVTLVEGGSETVEITLEPAPEAAAVDVGVAPPSAQPRSRFGLAPYIVGGAGAASLVASGVLFALRQSSLSELDRACPNRECPSSDQEAEYDRLKVYHYGSLVTLGVGLGAVGAAAAMLFFDKTPDPQREQARFTVRPNVSPNSASATVHLAF